MTAIAGFTDGHRVYIGGDSAGVAGWDLVIRRDPKAFIVGEYVFGFTTSFRMGQLIRYRFSAPACDQDIATHMSTVFIDSIRECLKAGGWAAKKEERESGGKFLVGFRGRLFMVDDDYQVGESADGYDACGCGDGIVRGALFAGLRFPMKPEDRILLALAAAERHSAGVRGPFVIASA